MLLGNVNITFFKLGLYDPFIYPSIMPTFPTL